MAIVKRVGPASAFKIGFIVYAMLGLIAGVLCSGLAFAGVHRLPFGGRPWMGILPLVLCPILYGIFGAVTTVIGAGIYNLASAWAGGLEVDIS